MNINITILKAIIVTINGFMTNYVLFMFLVIAAAECIIYLVMAMAVYTIC